MDTTQMQSTDKTSLLFDLGEAGRGRDWPDYLRYGFDQSDVPALLELVGNDALNQADADSAEVWVPLHAWRTLGQIGSDQAVVPLIALFDRLAEDSWAISELPKVMGMIGEPAINPLGVYLSESHHDEFARAMAADGLAEIVKRDPDCRERVVQCYHDYLSQPDTSARTLNGLLVCDLLDLDAKETIDDIRALFEKECVDISCAGDLEDVEIELGFRTERATPAPDLAEVLGLNDLSELTTPDSDEPLDIVDDYLMRYGNDDSILDVSELDGFFAALACAPNPIMPSRWMPAIWSAGGWAPEWGSEIEFTMFSQAAFALYNQTLEKLERNTYDALLPVHEIEGRTWAVVDEWCQGFMRGMALWGPQNSTDAALIEECTQSIRLFATDTGNEQLDSMNEAEVIARQDSIVPDVYRLFEHFVKQRRPVAQTFVRDTPKVGRNEPCPCGSGKKFKKCCLH